MKVTVHREIEGVTKFSAGDLAISDQGRIVVVTGDGSSAGTFAGTILHPVEGEPVHHATNWSYGCFRLFKGKITMENDK